MCLFSSLTHVTITDLYLQALSVERYNNWKLWSALLTYVFLRYMILNMKKANAWTIPIPAKEHISMYIVKGITFSFSLTMVESRGIFPPV